MLTQRILSFLFDVMMLLLLIAFQILPDFLFWNTRFAFLASSLKLCGNYYFLGFSLLIICIMFEQSIEKIRGRQTQKKLVGKTWKNVKTYKLVYNYVYKFVHKKLPH